jgi:hypothetical protein
MRLLEERGFTVRRMRKARKGRLPLAMRPSRALLYSFYPPQAMHDATFPFFWISKVEWAAFNLGKPEKRRKMDHFPGWTR